ATLAQWIERDNRHAALAYLLQLMQHARAIDPHILTEEHHAVGMVEIFNLHRADRNPNGLWQSNRSALVAHVGTVRQVVVAVHAREKLIHIRGFQRSAA